MSILQYLKESFRRKRARRVTREYPARVDHFHFDRLGEIEFANWDNPLYAPIELRSQMVDFFRQFIREGDMVIDIGANIGDTTVPMALCAGASGLSLGFDPNPYVYKILQKNATLNQGRVNIVPVPYAISSQEDEFYFISSEASFSNGGISPTKESKHGKFVHPEKIRGVNLKHFLEENYRQWLPKFSFIKIDTEGYDKEIIKSISDLLSGHKPVIVAESFGKSTDEEKMELYDVIAKMGYATETEARPLLPSSLYAPIEGEQASDPFGDAPWVVGEHARRRGLEVPGRLVASAKSWLSYAQVDRTAAILPWGGGEEAPHISPVEASAQVLRHVRRVWNQAFPADLLEDQEVVLTVPASFDEAARELTMDAAKSAGLAVRLLEEPQAAFYDFMHGAGTDALSKKGGALVLICDVGGGTTDLSLIRVSKSEITRVAVGHHLLLGGDNMDLALAHTCEGRLGDKKLDPARFGQLVLACRAAKEKLLGPRPPKDAAVTVVSAGAQLVGGTMTTRIDREEAARIVLDGFFPEVAKDARPERARSALVAFGLPYERDVAITRHVAWFLARHAEGEGPSAVLLNGGIFRAKSVGERLVSVIEQWGGPKPKVLPHADPDLAVARGAVVYGLSRYGHGVRIEGGAARGYYVGIGDHRGVCVVPRGAKEGVVHVATGREFALVVGRPVRFDLFASDDAAVHVPGEAVDIDDERFHALPPVAASFEPSRNAAELKVALEGELTPVGTVDLACVEIGPESPRRFRLAFQLRGAGGEAVKTEPNRPRSTIPPPSQSRRRDEAIEAIARVFAKGRKEATPREVKDLVRELERLLGDRASWTTPVARDLYDELWRHRGSRRRSPGHERIFWLLAGFCIRPGFGDPLDAMRISALAPLFVDKLAFPDVARGWQAFWIAWRRAAGGLDEAAQIAIRDTADPFLATEWRGKKPKVTPAALDDLRELASSLERVPAARRSELGEWLVERTWTDRDPRLWSAIGRIGARVPTYASVHHVVPGVVAQRWIEQLLKEKWDQMPTAVQAAVQLARVTGDRTRDIEESVRQKVEKRLIAAKTKEEWIRAVREHVPVAEAERAAFFGEGLPVGLRLLE